MRNLRRISLKSILTLICLVICFLLSSFIASNLTREPIDVDPALKCDCPTIAPQIITSRIEVAPVQQVAVPVSNGNGSSILVPQTFPPLPPCTPLTDDAPIQRAIIIYYPHHQSEYFFPEVRWLYRSWAEMLRGQPSNWRTDFVIFTYNFSAEYRSLGCVNRIRQNKEEPSICRLFLYVPIQFRTNNVTNNKFEHAFDQAKKLAEHFKDDLQQMVTVPMVNDPKTFDNQRSELLYVVLREYGYIDSINTLYEGYNTFKMYDFVMRTDIDVFIYRHFAKYIPKNCTFITGGGGYGTDFNRRRLKRVARDMDFAHAGVSGMGSTWYGSAYDAFLVANQTLHGMLWLSQYEFATPERQSKLGTLLWPEWHYGVLLLYGQHLALNHLVGTNQIRMIIGGDLLDQSSTDANPNYLQQGTRLNFHCWHTNERFSKFAFKLGHYKKSELEKYRNDTTAQAYAMRMALESKYMSLEQMANLVLGNVTSS